MNSVKKNLGTQLIGLIGVCVLCVVLAPTSFGADAVFSPYVLERFSDAMQWHSWNSEAIEEARVSEKPLLLTISHELNEQSASMANESFRNANIAEKTNSDFYSLAIDKNEFPALAESFAVYVWNAKQIKGWPLTLFLTPDFKPIEGGGYYSSTDGWGNQGFLSVIKNVGEQWGQSPDVVKAKAEVSIEELDLSHGTASDPSLVYDAELITVAIENLASQFDFDHGGFSLAPKVVSFEKMQLLDLAISKGGEVAESAKKMRVSILQAVLRGGVRDFVHGGFFTVSNDDDWVIANFQKTATQQAAAIEYFSKYPEYQYIVDEVAQSLVNDFRTDSGFYSENVVLSASSNEGEVGLAYTWSYDEVKGLLAADEFTDFVKYYSLKPEGNVPVELDITEAYSGRNLLRVSSEETGEASDLLKSALKKLREASRLRHSLKGEDVISLSTNAFVASALLKAGGESTDEARVLMDKLWVTHFDGSIGQLCAATRGSQKGAGEASSKGYALFIQALLDLGDRTEQAGYYGKAIRLQAIMDDRFGSQLGPYFIAPHDDESFPIKLYAFLETNTGSANAIAIGNLKRLAALNPESGFQEKASGILEHLPEEVSFAAELYPRLLLAAE